MCLRSLVCVCVTLFCTVGFCIGDITVDDDGPADYNSIQAGIDAAVNGDVVVVMPGTYTENITLSGKAITLRSSDPDNPAIVLSTIIDGGGLSTVITCNSGEGADTVIEGFVITGGEGNHEIDSGIFGGLISSGGMYCDNSSPTVTKCTFSGNHAFNAGGGICCVDSNVLIDGCMFAANSTDDSGGGGGVYCQGGASVINNCEFVNNDASMLGGGGGIYCESSGLTVKNSTFRGNRTEHGGGIDFQGSSNPTVNNCTFVDNTTAHGGAIACGSDSSPTIANCYFSKNAAIYSGGGIFCFNSSPEVVNCVFSSNTSTRGGGISCDNSSPILTDCSFGGNVAQCNPQDPIPCSGEGWGGGLFCDDGSAPVLTGCTFIGNTGGTSGGGLYISSSNPTLIDTILCTNTPEQISGNYTDGSGNVINDSYCPPPRPIIEGDLTGDRKVDMADLAMLAANWLAGTE